MTHMVAVKARTKAAPEPTRAGRAPPASRSPAPRVWFKLATRVPQPGALEVEADQAAQTVAGATPGANATQAVAATLPATAGDFAADMVSTLGVGAPLPPEARSELERQFGADFSSVRVHTDAAAAEAARATSAHAFTYGDHIAFAPGRFDTASMGGRQLLAHELTHVVQQGLGTAPRMVQRQANATTMSITPAYAESLAPEALHRQMRLVLSVLPRLSPGSAEHEQLAANLAVLESAVPTEPAASFASPLASYSPPPDDVPAVQPGDPDAGDVCVEEPLFSYAPATSEEAGVCVEEDVEEPQGAIVAGRLSEGQLIADYKRNARTLLRFHVDMLREWVHRVVRAQVTTAEGVGSEEEAVVLRSAAETANILGERAWRAQELVNAYDFLIAEHTPHAGFYEHSPVAGMATIGSAEYISERFTRAWLTARGMPEEMPDILRIVDSLGMIPTVTDEEIDRFIIESASEYDLYEAGVESLRETGELIYWGRHATPSEEWRRGYPYSDAEIREVGLRTIAQSDRRREEARMLLELDPERREAAEEEYAVLDIGAHRPQYNWVAVRYVLEGLRAQAVLRHRVAEERLEEHLAAFPLLRIYIRDWAVFQNTTFGGDYTSLIDPSAITASSLLEQLDELIEELDELKEDIDDDDDFLFDSAILQTLEPLIAMYEAVDPRYAQWIRDEFKATERWNEAISTLLLAAGIIGFGLAEVLTGGLATGALVVGLGATITSAVRSQMRADTLEAAAHAGIGSREAAAVAEFQAWLETAMAGLAVLSAVRPALAAVRQVAARVRLGRVTGPNIRTFVIARGTLTATEAAEIATLSSRLQDVLRRAVRLVDSGGGTTRWAQLNRLTPNPMFRGNAIHFEAYRIIQTEGIGAGRLLTNAGRAERALGLPNTFGRLRPDIRFSLDGVGREAIFDFTTFGQVGHSTVYATGRPWVASHIEILY
jgi:hypothetical protein